MSPYEIIDARISILEQMAQAYRWWVSITFAAIVAAYAAGPDLAGAPCALVITLYTIVTINGILMQSAFQSMGRTLRDEALTFQEGSASPSPSLEQMNIAGQRGLAVVRIQLATRGIMFVATIGYILYRAGYVG